MLSKMPTIFLIALNLILVFDLGFAQDFCSTNNITGDIEIWSAFRWNNNIHTMFVDIDGQDWPIYRINDFHWDGTDFTFTDITDVSTGAEYDPLYSTGGLNTMFSYNYTGKGLRLITMKYGEFEGVKQLRASLIDFEANPQPSPQEIDLDPIKCDSNADPLRLCSIFVKFPTEDISTNLLSMAPFPQPLGGLPPRFFVYYIETPPNPQKCNRTDCYNVKRFLFVGQTQTFGNTTQFNWMNDNSTDKCVDMKGINVSAAFPLTDYTLNGSDYYFDWIEFFGTEFTIFRVSINNLKEFEIMNELKTGSINSLLGCKSVTTTQQPTTTVSSTSSGPSTSSVSPTSSGPTTSSEPSTSLEEIDGTPTESTESQTPGPTSKPTTKTTKSSTFLIVGILLALLGIAIIIGLIVWCCASSKSNKSSHHNTLDVKSKSKSDSSKATLRSDQEMAQKTSVETTN